MSYGPVFARWYVKAQRHFMVSTRGIKNKSKQPFRIYGCPKAQTVSQRTILSRVPALFEGIYRACSICHQNQESSWQDSPSPPLLHVYAHMQLHTVMEKSQHSCWQLLSIKYFEKAWKGLSRHFSLQVCCPSLWFMISNISIVWKHSSDVLLIHH